MNIIETAIPEVKLVEPKVFGDHRGLFMESYNQERYENAGIKAKFLQDNISKSSKGVLRGLHLQNPKSQGKLVSVLEGEVFDVAVDVRVGSPTFGKWVGYLLNDENRRQLWVPRGFAHGFVVTSETATFTYKCDELYAPEHEMSVLWNDPKIGVEWPIENPTLSEKDIKGKPLYDFDDKELPNYEDFR